MKKYLFLLLFISPFWLGAQNFTNICSQGPAFYKKLNTNSLKAFKYTSFTAAAGDTIFYTFATVRDTAADCQDTTHGSILGRKIIRQSASYMFYFFNRDNDTIYINAKALLNDTWRFVKLSAGTYLEAKVVSMAPDSVMGVLDDMMRFELQAKRNDGTPVASTWNGKFLKLSKHYGLVRTYDFNNVPFDTTNYTLVGKLKPVIGVQEFGWKEVYNFNIGDVLHYSGYTNSTTGNPNTTYKEIQTVFAKTTYGANNDSVVYKFDRCRSTITNPGNNHTYVRDTLTVKYKFNVMGNDSTIMRLPDQFKRQNIYASQFDRTQKAYNNRQSKRITEDKYRFMNNCWVVPFGSVYLYRTYGEGLGQTEYYRDDQSDQEYNKLVYFKKGTETWGNAVGTQCSPILDVEENAAAPAIEARIVPNPMKTGATIELNGLAGHGDVTFTLYNLFGKVVYTAVISGNSARLERNALTTGMYVYTVTGKDGISKGKLVIE